MKTPVKMIHERRYRAILDSMSDGVLTTDLDMRITYFNKGAELITGVPRGRAIGKKCFEIMRSDGCKSDCCIKRTIVEGKRCDRSPVYIMRADNARIPVSVTSNIIINYKSNIIEAVANFRELSWGMNRERDISRQNYASPQKLDRGLSSSMMIKGIMPRK